MPEDTGKTVPTYGDGQRYVLSLYVTGSTPRSLLAIANIKSICERYLQGRCDLEIIDIYQHPEVVAAEQLLAAPTLIKRSPLPQRRLVGDMSNEERVLTGLDLQPKQTNSR